MMNKFLYEIFPKYQYHAIKMLNEEFKLQREVDVNDFKIPSNAMRNMDEHNIFLKYLNSDLMIESLRAMKLLVIKDLGWDHRSKKEMSQWAIDNILR